MNSTRVAACAALAALVVTTGCSRSRSDGPKPAVGTEHVRPHDVEERTAVAPELEERDAATLVTRQIAWGRLVPLGVSAPTASSHSVTVGPDGTAYVHILVPERMRAELGTNAWLAIDVNGRLVEHRDAPDSEASGAFAVAGADGSLYIPRGADVARWVPGTSLAALEVAEFTYGAAPLHPTAEGMWFTQNASESASLLHVSSGGELLVRHRLPDSRCQIVKMNPGWGAVCDEDQWVRWSDEGEEVSRTHLPELTENGPNHVLSTKSGAAIVWHSGRREPVLWVTFLEDGKPSIPVRVDAEEYLDPVVAIGDRVVGYGYPNKGMYVAGRGGVRVFDAPKGDVEGLAARSDGQMVALVYAFGDRPLFDGDAASAPSVDNEAFLWLPELPE